MTGTLCRSVALGCSIAPWVAMVVALFGIMIETILSIAEKVGDNSQVPSSRFCTAGWPGLPSLIWTCLSPPGLDMFLAAPAQIGGIAGVDRDVYPRPATQQGLSVFKPEKKAGRFPPRKANLPNHFPPRKINSEINSEKICRFCADL